MKRLSSIICTALALITGSSTHAATVTSPDGRWEAWVISAGSNAGQPTDFFDNNSGWGNIDNLALTRHYVRIGSPLLFNSMTTVRMEDAFEFVDFIYGSHSYTALLRAKNFSGVLAIVHGQMVSGTQGGLRVSLSFIDTTPSANLATQVTIKPFVLTEINAAGSSTNFFGAWEVDHFTQRSTDGFPFVERWFVARNATAHQSAVGDALEDALDAGLIELNNTSIPSGDLTCAVSFPAASINGTVHTVAYSIGNVGMTIPSTFGLPPTAGTVGITNGDWAASIRTGLGATDFGSAGEVASVSDFSRPLNEARFVNDTAYYLATTTDPTVPIQSMESTFRRVAFFYNPDAPHSFATILESKTQPGIIAVINGFPAEFIVPGVFITMKFIDITSSNRVVRPYVYADMNIDAATANTGGFDTDHFFQSSTLANGSTRWFKPASFDQYMSFSPALMLGWLNNGHHELNNTAQTGGLGGSDLATTFRMHAWRLKHNEPYITGFAFGNPGVQTSPFPITPSVETVCPADIAPLHQPDGQVNVSDLLAVISAWGPCVGGGPTCAADIAPLYVGDGTVNVNDLLNVISAWGDCPAS